MTDLPSKILRLKRRLPNWPRQLSPGESSAGSLPRPIRQTESSPALVKSSYITPTKEGAANCVFCKIKYGSTLAMDCISPIEIGQLLITGNVSSLLFGVAAFNKQLSIIYCYPKPKFGC